MDYGRLVEKVMRLMHWTEAGWERVADLGAQMSWTWQDLDMAHQCLSVAELQCDSALCNQEISATMTSQRPCPSIYKSKSHA